MTTTSVKRHSQTPSLRVVEAVAAETDTDPTELTPLGTVVDTDALDALVSSAGDLSVNFEYEGYRISIGSDDQLALEPLTGGI